MTLATSPKTLVPEPRQADGAKAFMAMLRRVHEISGLTAGQIAVSSGLPRSTAYRFIDRKNDSLPKNRDQVEAFLRACRLPTETVSSMLALWDDVSASTVSTSTPATDNVEDTGSWEEDAPEAPPAKVSEQIWRGFRDDPLPRSESAKPDVRSLESSLSVLLGQYARPRMLMSDPITPFLSGHCPACQNITTRLADRPRRKKKSAMLRAVSARLLPVLMLLLALYPMAMTVFFDHLFSNESARIGISVLLMATMLLTTSDWIHRPQLLTPLRLTMAICAGITVAVIAWLAVPIPLVGVLTGFIVFTATPLWLNRTNLSDITSTRGLFCLISASWCGIAVGFIVNLARFPILGSVLAGFLTAAATVMLLSSSIRDRTGCTLTSQKRSTRSG